MIWLTLRLAKFLALGLFVSGVFGALTSSTAAARRRAAFSLATTGFVLLWLAGYGLVKSTGRSLAEPFVAVALVASLGVLHATLGAATRAAVRPSSRVLGLGGLCLSIASMVVRDGNATAWSMAVGGAVITAAILLRATSLPPADDGDPAPETWAWFRTIAHLEGASLLFMLGVAMPVRHATGLSLDAGTGAIGWLHGTLLFVYLSGLVVTKRVLGWSLGHAALGFVAGMVPFGTFWFVRRKA